MKTKAARSPGCPTEEALTPKPQEEGGEEAH